MSGFPALAELSNERAFTWIAILAGCLVVGGVAVQVARRYMHSSKQPEAGPALTLGQLREMRDRGQVTPKEFERLKQLVLDQARKAEKTGAKGPTGGLP